MEHLRKEISMQSNISLNNKKNTQKNAVSHVKNLPKRILIFMLFAVIAVILLIPFYTLFVSTFKDGALVIANVWMYQ